MKFLHLLVACQTVHSFTTRVPICIQCKHYKKDFLQNSKYGKCTLFPIDETDNYYLVNGVKTNLNEYYYCSTTRGCSSMCGNEGIHFEKK